MYSRDFSGIKSDGQLREFQENLYRQYETPAAHRHEEHIHKPKEEEKKGLLGGLNFDFLKNIKLEDLLLIGIGLLILFGKEEHDTLILILIAALVIF